MTCSWVMLLSLHYVTGYEDVAPMELELTEILKKVQYVIHTFTLNPKILDL